MALEVGCGGVWDCPASPAPGHEAKQPVQHQHLLPRKGWQPELRKSGAYIWKQLFWQSCNDWISSFPPTVRYTFKYFRWILQPCPSFYLHQNIPYRFVSTKMNIFRFSFSTANEQEEKTSLIKKMRWDICKIIISDLRSIFSTWAGVFI